MAVTRRLPLSFRRDLYSECGSYPRKTQAGEGPCACDTSLAARRKRKEMPSVDRLKQRLAETLKARKFDAALGALKLLA